jgi:hypothetical protein
VDGGAKNFLGTLLHACLVLSRRVFDHLRVGRAVRWVAPQIASTVTTAPLCGSMARVPELMAATWRSESTLGTTDFTVAFTGAAALALLSLGFGWTLRHDAAAEVSGHRSKSAEV